MMSRELYDSKLRVLELEKQIKQLKADAELGRAVRKAFSQAYNVNPSYGYVRGALLNEDMLIEWAEGVE